VTDDDFDAALEKLKRVPKGVPAGKAGRLRSVGPAGDATEERLHRIEERLGAVEEALHALQSKLSS